MKDSRSQLRIAGTLLVVAGVAATQAVAAPPADVDDLGGGVYTFRSGDQRSLFLVTDKGVIVTDPISAKVAPEYRRAIAAVTDQPVRYVVYSHYHWDRVAGGRLFQSAGAKIVAQRRCAERFRVNPNPDVAMPDITFDDHYRVSLGGKSLGLHYFGPSHGDCLTVFLVEPANMLQVVELVNPPRAAFPEDPTVPYIKPHNLKKFFASLQSLATEKNVQKVIASSALVADGKGGKVAIPATGPVSIIADQARFWDAIYRAVEISDAKGTTNMDSFVPLSVIDLDAFRPYDRFEPKALPIIMRRFVGYYDMGR